MKCSCVKLPGIDKINELPIWHVLYNWINEDLFFRSKNFQKGIRRMKCRVKLSGGRLGKVQ
jgi:hypothetical protein